MLIFVCYVCSSLSQFIEPLSITLTTLGFITLALSNTTLTSRYSSSILATISLILTTLTLISFTVAGLALHTLSLNTGLST